MQNKKKHCWGILVVLCIFIHSKPIFADPFDSNICNALHELSTLVASKIQGYSPSEQLAIKACADEYYTSQYKKRNFKCTSKEDYEMFIKSLARRATAPTVSQFNIQMVAVSCILKIKTVDNWLRNEILSTNAGNRDARRIFLELSPKTIHI